MTLLVCPQHSREDEIRGTWVSDDVGWEYTCPLDDHEEPGPFTWLLPPPPPQGSDLSGLAQELGLRFEVPGVLKEFGGQWVEYGVFEHAYATTHPKDWAGLVDRYGHRSIASKPYTASAFLAAALRNLSLTRVVEFHAGPATGRWAYNGVISYWALPPAPDWSHRLAWKDAGLSVDYVPGQSDTH